MRSTTKSASACVLVLVVLSLCSQAADKSDAAAPTSPQPAGKVIVTVAKSTPDLPRKGEADVIELKSGKLLLVSMEFGGEGTDYSKTRLVAHESADSGATWSGRRVVSETSEGDVNVYSPNLIASQDGGILLIFHRYHGKVAEIGDSYTLHIWKSTDEGRTFAPLAQFAERKEFALCNATIKRLGSGRLLLPASPAVPGDHGPAGKYAATVLYSDDDGVTWQEAKRRLMLPKRGAMEPHVEETGDGRVLMVMRNQLGFVYQSESKDGGVNWSDPTPTSLVAPESCPELTRIPSTGDLLLIWNPTFDAGFRSHFGKRSPLTAAISRDHGRTWEMRRNIESDSHRAFSNPGCRFTRGGKAIVNYWTCEYLKDWAMQDIIDLRVAVIDTAWFYGVGAAAATTSQPVHPILIRNDQCAVAHVAVTIPDEGNVRATGFTFQLDGTDDLADIDSVTLFATGDKAVFAANNPVGEGLPARKAVEFRGDIPLRPGVNHFWLACRLKASAGLDRHVAAMCSLVETTAGPVVPTKDTAVQRHRIGVALRRAGDDGVHTYRIPALATSVKGTLLCVYDIRRRAGRDLQEDIDIGLSRSFDGGQTWDAPQVIMDMGEYGGLAQALNGCSDPGIIVDRQTGEIFCFAVWMNGKPGKHQWNDDGSEPGFEIGTAAQFMLVRSKDDGKTWSAPVNLTKVLKRPEWWLLAPAPQQGISLADGTLVMPVQGRTGRNPEATFATIMTSKDHGETWTVKRFGYEGGNECQAALLGSGAIMLNVRNDRERFRAISVTSDLGETWTPHETSRKALIEPNCNGSLMSLEAVVAGKKQTVLVFANPHSQKSRTHHTIQVSFDDGRTWPESHHLLLDEGRGAGYPSLTRIDDRHIGIVYEGSQAHLVFEKFSIERLLTGRRAAP